MRKIIFPLLAASIIAACNNSQQKETPVAPVALDEQAEKKTILAVIEAETESFYKRDYEAWKKHYVQADYSFQAWNNGDGTIDAKTGWAEVDAKIGQYIRENPVKEGGSSHPEVIRKNMVVKFFTPQVAYLVWDQYNSDQEKKNYTFSKEERIMEKIGGEWKIANVSAFWNYKKIIPRDSL